MQHCCAGIAEAMVEPSRYDDRLASRYRFALILDPEFGLSFQHGQHLFDGMQMRRRSATGLAPLLENAQLHRASDGRHPHAGHHSGPPLFT